MKPLTVLVLLCVALALAIAAETRDTVVLEGGDARPAVSVPLRGETQAAPSGADTRIATILARPLFTPARRPPAQAAPAAMQPPEMQALPRLSAIVAGPFGRHAIFAGAPGRHSLTVSVGDQVQEFRVQSINERDVILSGPAGLRQIRPTLPGTPAASPAQAGAASPAFDLPPGVLPEDVAPAGQPGRTP